MTISLKDAERLQHDMSEAISARNLAAWIVTCYADIEKSRAFLERDEKKMAEYQAEIAIIRNPNRWAGVIDRLFGHNRTARSE